MLDHIEKTYQQVHRDLNDLLIANDLIYYTAQIAGRDSSLHSFKLSVPVINSDVYTLKNLFSYFTKELASFSRPFRSRGLSFFHSIPHEETREEFFRQPFKMIDELVEYGLQMGRPISNDPNPIYEAFGTAEQFPHMKEIFKNALLLFYRNVLLADLFYPLSTLIEVRSNEEYLVKENGSEPDIEQMFNDIFVIESESGLKQGTAFYVDGVGLITCDHCIRDDATGGILDDLKIFRGNQLKDTYNVSILKTNKDIDVAILECKSSIFKSNLKIGQTSGLRRLQRVSVAGYPNYNYGDEGYVTTGEITAFRTYVGLRHILVNCPLISGNSGGPAFDEKGLVVGIVVTGAEKLSKAHETEKHCLIPIEAIRVLLEL